MILKKTKKTESIQVPKDVITKERTQYYLAAQWMLYISSDTGHQSLCCHTPLEKKNSEAQEKESYNIGFKVFSSPNSNPWWYLNINSRTTVSFCILSMAW